MPGDVTVDAPERIVADLSDRELAGLDALEYDELGERSRAWRVWSSLWPKLAAVAIAIVPVAVVVWSNWKPEYVLPGPRKVFPTLWRRRCRRPTSGRRSATRCGGRCIGFGLSLLIGSLVGAAVVRVRVLRTAVGSMITGLQTMPSIAWFPLAILLFQLSEARDHLRRRARRGAVDRQRLDHRRRPHPADPPARRATCSARAASRSCGHVILPAALPELRRRAQAGLGVRVAQPDGRRAAGRSSPTSRRSGVRLRLRPRALPTTRCSSRT